VARDLFLNLTELGEGAEDTRRIASREELLAGADAGTLDSVLETLVRARLITTSKGEVEVAHEALIRRWPTLKEWLADNRERLRFERQMARDAAEWEQSGRDPGILYRGSRLAQAQENMAQLQGKLPPLSQRFIEASLSEWQREIGQKGARERQKLEQERALAEAQRQRAEEAEKATVKQSRLTRIAFAVGGVALILFFVACGASAWAAFKANEATTNANLAATREAEAEALALNAQTQALMSLSISLLPAKRNPTDDEASRSLLMMAQGLEQSQMLANPVSPRLLDDQARRLLAAMQGRPLQRILTGHEYGVGSVTFDPEGRWLASGSWDRTIRLWELSDLNAAPLVLAGHEDWVLSVTFDPEGRRLASGSDDRTIRLWDLSDLDTAPRVLTGHEGGVWSVAFDPEGRWLASGSADGTIRLWELPDLDAAPRVLAGHEDWVWSVAFDPEGRRLASGSNDRTIRLWDLSDLNAAPLVLTGHEAGVLSVAFDPEGRRLASGSYDGTIRLWELPDLDAAPRVLAGHEGGVLSVAFDPEGRRLASGSNDGTIRLWDLSDLDAEPRLLAGHEDWVFSVAFDSEGRRLASGSNDGTIRLWRSTLEELAVFACERAGRNFSWDEWQEWLPGRPYRQTCPQWPPHPSVPPEELNRSG
jgi:WD40 repeat protein